MMVSTVTPFDAHWISVPVLRSDWIYLTQQEGKRMAY